MCKVLVNGRGTVGDGSGMGLWNPVGWVGDFEEGLWQSVGMWLVVVEWQAAGWLFTAVWHCSFSMQLDWRLCWGVLPMVTSFQLLVSCRALVSLCVGPCEWGKVYHCLQGICVVMFSDMFSLVICWCSCVVMGAAMVPSMLKLGSVWLRNKILWPG